VGSDEVAEMSAQLVVVVVVVALNGGFFDGAVHALHLSVGPGMIGFREPVIDAMQATDSVERMTTKASRRSLAILRQVGELDAVIRQHGVEAVRNSRDQRFQKSHSGLHVGTFNQRHESELRGAVDGHEEIKLAPAVRTSARSMWK
jgi:hypothetical protein